MSRIVVVEDEAHLAQGLRFNLEAEGHEVTRVRQWRSGARVPAGQRRKARRGDPGCHASRHRWLRRRPRAAQGGPVHAGADADRAQPPGGCAAGFESGADDYLPKPFDLAILVARINSLLRRSAWSGESQTATAAAAEKDEPPFEFDGRTVDFRALELRTGSGIFKLTLMEADLLRYLIRESRHARLAQADPAERMESSGLPGYARHRQLHRAPAALPGRRPEAAAISADGARRGLQVRGRRSSRRTWVSARILRNCQQHEAF